MYWAERLQCLNIWVVFKRFGLHIYMKIHTKPLLYILTAKCLSLRNYCKPVLWVRFFLEASIYLLFFKVQLILAMKVINLYYKLMAKDIHSKTRIGNTVSYLFFAEQNKFLRRRYFFVLNRRTGDLKRYSFQLWWQSFLIKVKEIENKYIGIYIQYMYSKRDYQIFTAQHQVLTFDANKYGTVLHTKQYGTVCHRYMNTSL